MSAYKPPNHNALSPYLLVRSVRAQLAFLIDTFAATVLETVERADGSVQHAEVRIDDSIVMMGERPASHGSMPCSVHVYVPNVDATYAAALRAGAESLSEPKDQSYGDRSAGVRDVEGNVWWLGTKIQV